MFYVKTTPHRKKTKSNHQIITGAPPADLVQCGMFAENIPRFVLPQDLQRVNAIYGK